MMKLFLGSLAASIFCFIFLSDTHDPIIAGIVGAIVASPLLILMSYAGRKIL